MGTMYPAIDTTAGEKERGTLETVLTLPVTNQELFFSKFLTVATIGLASALLNIISMGGIGIYMYNTVLSVSGMSGINVNQFVPAICIALLCVFAFAVFISAISMCVCVFAKSYKEANNYITPLTLVVMFASMVSIVPNVSLTSNMALVPVVNICLLIRDLLVFKYDISIIMLVLISNVIYGMLSVIILGKMYNSEAILFGDGSASLQIFEKRSNMKKGGVPSIGDMVLIIAITIVATIYIGGAIQLKWGYYGVLCTQFIILIIPIFAAWYTKKDIKETFRLRIPRLGYVLGGIMSVVGALLLGMIITGISSYIFKSSATELGESMNAILGDSFIETLLLVAVVPAFCEEIMFRGYVLSSMDKVFKPRNAIIVSGIIFGLYHMNLVQSFTTAFLGIVIGYVAYKSGSIFPGVIMHFINNALACVVMYYPETVKKILPILVKETFTTKDMIIVFVTGFVILTMGILLVKTTSKNKK
ncbi:MAG: CPBP family intramembrane metalloprotease, partial [Lachnospiraceae bacterium]|nr:CPBP family intramembrane metalloprotease [Lachnospiraceae bacterium]